MLKLAKKNTMDCLRIYTYTVEICAGIINTKLRRVGISLGKGCNVTGVCKCLQLYCTGFFFLNFCLVLMLIHTRNETYWVPTMYHALVALGTWDILENKQLCLCGACIPANVKHCISLGIKYFIIKFNEKKMGVRLQF